MKKLSVALAIYNEEKNLKKCLSSLHGLANEIVIVDGESKDRSVEISNEFKARVISKPNQKNFHINKQIAIDECKFDWILQLDADEVVSNELKKEIMGKLEEDNIGNLKYNGFYIPRKNWFLGRFLMKGGQYPDYTLRLYRNGKGKLPQKNVHEQAVVDGEVGFLNTPLLHYPYENFSTYLAKWNRYNLFESNLIAEKMNNSSIFRKIFAFFMYLFFHPLYWFLLTFIRHKGFLDLWPGFVFCLFSSLRFPASYILYLKSL